MIEAWVMWWMSLFCDVEAALDYVNAQDEED